MKSFLARFAPLILSFHSGCDWLRFRRTSRLLCNPRGVNSYLYQHDLLIKEFPDHAAHLTRQLVQGTETRAQADGYPIHYLNSPNRDKEATGGSDAETADVAGARLDPQGPEVARAIR